MPLILRRARQQFWWLWVSALICVAGIVVLCAAIRWYA